MRSFASDNNAGVHPRVMAAIAEANRGHAVAYGDDPWTERGIAAVRRALDAPDAEVLFAYNGTGANVIGLGAVMRSFEAVICSHGAHLDVDECGAPERIAGVKLLPIVCQGNILTPELVATRISGVGDEHHVQPRVVSITQATELGRVYSAANIRALADHAHAHNLLLHMDGARLANAAAALDCDLADITSRAGVDVVSLGGTKNGLMFGEAVVFLRPELGAVARYHRKQAAQLASKMRYISAQFEALFGGNLWRDNARHANAMATRLADGLRARGIEITQDVEANAVFARLTPDRASALRQRYFFYDWNPAEQEVRFMTCFDTTGEDIDGFLAAVES